jgi:hypothetical protein
MKAPGFVLIVTLFLLPISSSAQRGGFPSPPPPMNSQAPAASNEPTTITRPLDIAELQKEADDLARTAQTIPEDMTALRKGTLPKDLIEKLKRIEKLSKRLRSQVAP